MKSKRTATNVIAAFIALTVISGASYVLAASSHPGSMKKDMRIGSGLIKQMHANTGDRSPEITIDYSGVPHDAKHTEFWERIKNKLYPTTNIEVWGYNGNKEPLAEETAKITVNNRAIGLFKFTVSQKLWKVIQAKNQIGFAITYENNNTQFMIDTEQEINMKKDQVIFKFKEIGWK